MRAGRGPPASRAGPPRPRRSPGIRRALAVGVGLLVALAAGAGGVRALGLDCRWWTGRAGAPVSPAPPSGGAGLPGAGSRLTAEPPTPASAAVPAFAEPPSAPSCVPEYRDLPVRLGLVRDPSARARLLEAARSAAWSEEPPTDPPALAARVRALSGVDRLAGTASWIAGPPQPRGASSLRSLEARDPLFGAWPAVRLAPPAPGPHPAVLLLHGHGDTLEEALTLRFGDALAGAGFVVLAPSIRAYWDGDCEDEAAWSLLEAGLTLLGVHLAEAARAVEQLRADPEVDPARIFVVGHSGGSTLARVLPAVAPVAGVISDGPPSFGTLPPDERIGDDFVPALRPLGGLLGGDGALGVPAASLAVGPEGSIDAVLDQLAAWGGAIGPGDRVPSPRPGSEPGRRTR